MITAAVTIAANDAPSQAGGVSPSAEVRPVQIAAQPGIWAGLISW